MDGTESAPAGPSGAARYHRDLARRNREALLGAARRLFLDLGYDGTSLAKVAAEAGVSRATLFKQFPTKAELFSAMVTTSWAIGDEQAPPVPGDPLAALTTLGTRYADLLTRPGMADLFRIVIAELPRFPELGRTHFDLGKMPFFDSVRDHLLAEQRAGTLRFSDADLVATQFLGMIANYVLWPRMLLLDWDPDAASVARAVEEAALTVHARHATAEGPGPEGAARPGGVSGSS
ncbi:TetR/AcrR family transcriptional regulator [Actinomycetospora straminea]|uniref:TetR/AcrR family transcriptional regulator n=1 Tax=Actinomycetospora straminea TaxID=663607 RepID=A0ABP9E1P0_9PSEU|nr:TetR/AcrR family transcriptional regulator [Actinomycetospora straminea]MDD7931386.1 TetR/AcrR family transcriptional regulator [Actinomycetospora straminea]